MKKINAIILMAGKGERTTLNYNKALYNINMMPLFMYSVKKFMKLDFIENIYLVVRSEDFDIVNDIIKQNNLNVNLVLGASTRSESVKKALIASGNKLDVIIHDAARPLVSTSDIITLVNTTNEVGTLYHKVTDTIKFVDDNGSKTINRDNLKAVSTPQYFSSMLISDIINNHNDYTDELQIFENKYNINYVLESSLNIKVTTFEDLKLVEKLMDLSSSYIGHSYDFHKFQENRKLILGGVTIPYEVGLLGHSDADALYHAVTEAIIGALGLGDIGTLFPDTSEKYKDMDSSYFVKEVVAILNSKNKVIKNIDAIIYIEKPNLKNYKTQMALNIKKLTNCEMVNVKATTMEKQGLVGNGVGIGCEVVCLISDKE